MNRRKFFGGIAAAITAIVIPIDFRDQLHGVPITWDYDPSVNVWWCDRTGIKTFPALNYIQAEARTIAALERAWKECTRTGQAPSQIWITDTELMELGDEIHRSRRA